MELIPKMYGDVKPSLIDLEASGIATGRKHILIMQRERLSEKGIMYCVYWIRKETHSDVFSEGYVGISKDFKERMRSHKRNKKNTILTKAIKSIGWDNLKIIVLHYNLSLEEALEIENKLRPIENIGWNLQRGGFLGVNPEWYKEQSNKEQHSNATSEGTKLGIQKNDTTEKRSLRARKSVIDNKESYINCVRGEKNPRAILTEEEVHFIKYTLFPFGLSNIEISIFFDVKHYVISFIRNGKNWKHI